MDEQTRPAPPVARRGALALLARGVLFASALAAFALAAGVAPDGGSDLLGLLIFSGLGIALRFIQRTRRPGGAVSLAAVFVGASVIALSPAFALITALVIGAGASLRGAPARTTLDRTLTLVLTAGAGAATKRWADAAIEGPTVGDGAVGLPTVLLVAVVLAATSYLFRWFMAWLDRRARLASFRAHRQARVLQDVAFAAVAVILGVLWLVYPPMLLVALVPVVLVTRTANEGVLTGLTRATDELTGLGNAGMMRVALAEELARSEQFDRPLAVLVVDIDRMSHVNTTYGFDTGDEVVRAIGERLRDIGREYDVVARIGGDSFAALLPEISPAAALRVAERVVEMVAATPVATSNDIDIAVTVSVGVAAFPGDASAREELLTEAELASAYARVDGGNRAIEASKLPPSFRGTTGAGFARRPAASHGDTSVELLGARGARIRPDDHDQLVRAIPEPLTGARTRTDRLLYGVVGLAAVATVVGAVLDPRGPDVGRLLLFALLGIAAEWLSESVYRRAAVSWAAVPLIALAVLEVGPLEASLAAVLVSVIGGTARKVRGRQLTFNAGALVLSTLIAALAVSAFRGVVAASGLAAAILGGGVAGAAFFTVNTWLVVLAVTLSTGLRAAQVYRDDFAWLAPHHAAMAAVGGGMAFAAVTPGLGTLGVGLLAVPGALLHQAQRQFLTRTRDHVGRLRALNEDLQHANTRIVRVNDRLSEALEQVNQGYLVTVESLAAAVDAKDLYTGSHIDRVEAYARALIEILDPDLAEDEALLWGFRLHDVGKIGIPDRVLLKEGPLDDDEWDIMKRHPEIGAQIIAAAPFLQGARDVVLHHHERWDGRGYPFGLQGNGIPFSARAFTIIDAFDAMTSTRPYRKAMSVEQAIEEVVRNQGRQFDPEMVEAFLQIDQEEFVRLSAEVETERDQRMSRAGGLLIPLAEGLGPRPLAGTAGTGDDPPRITSTG